MIEILIGFAIAVVSVGLAVITAIIIVNMKK